MKSMYDIERARLVKRLQELLELDAFYGGLLFGDEDGNEAAELWIQKDIVMSRINATLVEIDLMDNSAKVYINLEIHELKALIEDLENDIIKVWEYIEHNETWLSEAEAKDLENYIDELEREQMRASMRVHELEYNERHKL